MPESPTSPESFKGIYTEEFRRDYAEHRHYYNWAPGVTAEVVIARMCAAFDAGTYNKDSIAIRAACKRLRIPHTYKAINAQLRWDAYSTIKL